MTDYPNIEIILNYLRYMKKEDWVIRSPITEYRNDKTMPYISF